MRIDLNRETENLVNREIAAGHFETPQEVVATAVRQFALARELADRDILKLAMLRADLERADEQIERGECSEYDDDSLKGLFDEVESGALRRLSQER